MSVQVTVIGEGLSLVCVDSLSSFSRFWFLRILRNRHRSGAMSNGPGAKVGVGAMNVVAEGVSGISRRAL